MTAAALIPIVPALFGLVVGSFLNVVIYRLPRDLSVWSPRWSFCPHCHVPIRATDNIPVLGWLRLGGRCRACRQPISARYPLIELLTAILFVTVYDALVAPHRETLGRATGGWVMLLAYLALFSSLLANAVMDAEEYLVDLRVTHFATAIGVTAQGVRGILSPQSDKFADPALGIAAVAALLAGLISFWRAARRDRCRQPESDLMPPDESPPHPEPPAAPPSAMPGAHTWSILLLAFLLAAQTAAVGCWPALRGEIPRGPELWRAFFVVNLFTFILVRSMMDARPIDEEMVDLLEEERVSARRLALRELGLIGPGIVVAFLVLWGLRRWCGGLDWGDLFALPPPASVRFIAGLQTAVVGAAVATLFGWIVRVFFTLVFGREAFGVGDIHLMAAIGAVGGAWMCLVAFFAAGLLGLVGVLAARFRRSVRALPFGPWLAVGAMVALWSAPPMRELFWPPVESLIHRLAG